MIAALELTIQVGFGLFFVWYILSVLDEDVARLIIFSFIFVQNCVQHYVIMLEYGFHVFIFTLLPC